MKCLFILLLTAVMGLTPLNAMAQSALQKEIEVQQKKLEKLQKQITKKRKNIKSLEGKEFSILKDLQDIDNQIVEQWENLQKTKKAWTEKELHLVTTKKECDELQESVSKLKKQVELRLGALYKMGTIGTLNVIFSAETLPQIISRHNSLKVILMHDSMERLEFLGRLKKLYSKEAQLRKEREELILATRDLEAQGDLLSSLKKEKELFLETILSKKENVRKTADELKKAQGSLKKLISQLEASAKKIPEGLKSEYVAADAFSSQKGKLPPPVEGALLKNPRALFKQKSNGLIFKAPLGSEIRAVFDGVVVYNGMLKGYGNVLILDHGELYYSLIAQGAKFFPQVGQEVIEGDLVGVVGGGPWIKEGIYFEIRHGGKEEEPKKWLNLKGVPVT